MIMLSSNNGIPKFAKSKILKDEGCPTCGSMNFAILEIMNLKDIIKQKFQCHNCKKFWYN
ncbi:MAG: hypothetical protein D4R90_05585 [Nitrosopumilales archaeon]|nr:MAG: hypothetical protein D4R90_05585 [Nitrosopumilales archaeon]